MALGFRKALKINEVDFFYERVKIGCRIRVGCVLIVGIPLDDINHRLRTYPKRSSRTSFEETASCCAVVFVNAEMRFF